VDRASQDGGLGAVGARGSIAPVLPSHAPTPAATLMDFAQALLRQRAPMEPSGGSGQEMVPRQAAAVPLGNAASAAPRGAPPPTMDPAETSLGIP
jgi:hypothetical protein